MTPEGVIQAYLVKQVKAAGGKQRKLRWIGRRSAPDQLVWIRAPGALVEVKRPGKDATDAQAREHERLRADGWIVHVINSKEGVDRLILDLRTQ